MKNLIIEKFQKENLEIEKMKNSILKREEKEKIILKIIIFLLINIFGLSIYVLSLSIN